MPEAPDLSPRDARAPGPGGPLPRSGDVLFTVPNLITLGRLCAVPAAVWLVIQHRLDLAFLVFVGAGVSDAVDGWWARVFNARSFLGSVLDPVADKALLVSMYVSLAVINVLPDWLAILVVFRDLLIVGGVMVLALTGASPAIRPLPISKLNTALQIVLAGLALMLEGFALPSGWLLPALIGCVAATTVASGIAYVLAAARTAPP